MISPNGTLVAVGFQNEGMNLYTSDPEPEVPLSPAVIAGIVVGSVAAVAATSAVVGASAVASQAGGVVGAMPVNNVDAVVNIAKNVGEAAAKVGGDTTKAMLT